MVAGHRYATRARSAASNTAVEQTAAAAHRERSAEEEA